MKNKALICIILLLLSLLLCSCNFSSVIENTSASEKNSSEELKTTEQSMHTSAPKTTEETNIHTYEPKTTEKANIHTSEPESGFTGEKHVGVTARGYEIIEINGVTYIDGIIIVNKTYSLPANFPVSDLTPECVSAFNEMVEAAKELGLSLYNSSGFRSYELQKRLYNNYCERDGKAAADTYSARPGHSEHQTGLAIDLNTITSSFADTAEGKWVAENCYKYGFILRYGKDKEEKTGYMYEPWHIRYVGKNIAEKIYNSGLCIEEYYGITSEYN